MRRFVSAFVPIALAVAFCGCSRGTSTGTDPTPTTPTAPRVVTLSAVVDITTDVNVTAGYTGTFNWAGQSATIPAGAGIDHVRFSFYDGQKNPTAFGKLLILDREYLGTPANLNSSTPGWLATSTTIADGEYVFVDDVKLNGGTRYWFYTDTQGSFWGSFDTDIYPPGDLYVSGMLNLAFRRAQASGRMVNGVYVPPPAGVYVDANFRIRGAAR
jgi:hypothetical protein